MHLSANQLIHPIKFALKGIAVTAVLTLLSQVIDQATIRTSSEGFIPAATAADAEAPKVEWKTLRGLNYRTGEQTPALKSVNGKTVRVPGYMVPLEDDQEQVTEFLLVPYVGACIHTPPPPPNQIVHVKSGKKVPVSFWEPIWASGKLDISTIKSPFGDVSYQMTLSGVEPFLDY